MPNYEKLYHILFNATTDALKMLKIAQQENAVTEAIAILQQAQQNTEEAYMSAQEGLSENG